MADLYVVTNRAVDDKKSSLDKFRYYPSEKGPNELRLVKVKKTGNRFKADILDDKLTKTRVAELKKKYKLEIDEKDDWYASLEAACEMFDTASKAGRQKPILFYVHGYNNNMNDVLTTCFKLQTTHNVLVVPFCWPANGGGIEGTAAYLSDKQDARVSADALNRVINKIGEFHDLFSEGLRKRLKEEAQKKHPDNPLASQQLYSQLIDRDCKTTINMMCHSMGNYLLKYALMPSAGASRKLVFDNVCLVAADANNANHENWVERLQTRNRVYVAINENDFALKWSRRKPGDEQLPRLGHYPKNLNASNAYYLNLTRAKGVNSAHTYFVGEPVTKNSRMKLLFRRMFSGESVEDLLEYQADTNCYTLK